VARATAPAELSALPVGRILAVGDSGTPSSLVLEPGPLHATLVVAEMPLGELPEGTRLRLGRTVIVELTGPTRAGGLREAQDEPLRVGARVVTPGLVAVGDGVTVEAVALPLEDVLDLHPFRPDEVAEVVREYLARAQVAGYGEVRLVHGRGHGVQRETVRRLLAATPSVTSFTDAPPERGGWGATIARLRPARVATSPPA
jgi:Smr domain